MTLQFSPILTKMAIFHPKMPRLHVLEDFFVKDTTFSLIYGLYVNKAGYLGFHIQQ